MKRRFRELILRCGATALLVCAAVGLVGLARVNSGAATRLMTVAETDSLARAGSYSCFYLSMANCQTPQNLGFCAPAFSETKDECLGHASGCYRCSNDLATSVCKGPGGLYKTCNTVDGAGGCGNSQMNTGCAWVDDDGDNICACEDQWNNGGGLNCDSTEVQNGTPCPPG